ncbi:unnamed protein product [Withania somnifera]
MADHSRATSHEFCSSFGFGSVCKVCKSFVSILSPKRTHQQDQKPKSNHHKVYVRKGSVDEDVEELRHKHNGRLQGIGLNNKHQSNEHYYYTNSPISSPPGSRSTSPSRLSRTFSRIFRTTSVKNHNVVHTNNDNGGGGANVPHYQAHSRVMSVHQQPQRTSPVPLSRNMSRRSSTRIMFSNSTGLVKPPPTEETLECTLDELCFGCVKKIKVTRVAITHNGWTKGTKITFEGKGNDRPGTFPADVIFVIAEKRHHMFGRNGENLELAVEIPPVKALTEKMSLTVDDVICHGYEKIIEGQGMPKPKEEGNRGNLIVTFLVAFPTELSEEKRADVVRILQDCC